jgi:hypothetical protein
MRPKALKTVKKPMKPATVKPQLLKPRPRKGISLNISFTTRKALAIIIIIIVAVAIIGGFVLMNQPRITTDEEARKALKGISAGIGKLGDTLAEIQQALG